MRASTGPRRPAVWEAAADECGLCLNLYTRFVGGNVYFLGQRSLAHQSLGSWRYFALCSASCVAFGCRSWAQTLLEKKNAAHTHTHTQTEQSFGFIIINWIKSFWLTTDWKTRVSFSLFHISQPLWVEFFRSSFFTVKAGLLRVE